MSEIWKDIKTNPNYMISNWGRVKSKKRIVNRSGGRILPLQGKLLKQSNDKDGYLKVSLWTNGIMKTGRVSRLVAEAFIPNPENKPEVNHKNGVRYDNRVENLEWVTTKENINDLWRNGRGVKKWGLDHHNSKLNESDVLAIKQLFRYANHNPREISKDMGVSYNTIYRIINRERYQNIEL